MVQLAAGQFSLLGCTGLTKDQVPRTKPVSPSRLPILGGIYPNVLGYYAHWLRAGSACKHQRVGSGVAPDHDSQGEFGSVARRSLSQPGGEFRLRSPADGQMTPRLEPLPRGSAEIVTVEPRKRFADDIGDSLVATGKSVVPRDTKSVTGCQGREVRLPLLGRIAL